MSALDFANSVLATAGEGTTHLKLQKLMFYAYGAAVAHGQEPGQIVFHRWKHGPVSVPVYETYRESGSEVLEAPTVPLLTGAALDAVRVYRMLSAWQLREESHLEAPWLETAPGAEIPDKLIRDHFRAKFASGRVVAPRNMPGSWSLAVDGLPGLSAESLSDLAAALS